MKFKKGDRIIVSQNGLAGVIVDISFNSIYQKQEYIVRWDSFPNQDTGYDVDDGDLLWELDLSFQVPIQGWSSNVILESNGMEWFENPSMFTKCSHDWAEYQGFSENYSYCKKCDEKRMS